LLLWMGCTPAREMGCRPRLRTLSSSITLSFSSAACLKPSGRSVASPHA
jgi:hypothetical protein